MWKENGTTLSSYVKKKCEENEDGIWQIGNVMFACDDDGNLYFTDSQGNTSVISIADNGEVSIEGGVSADGSVNDNKAPSVSATSTTNSITFVAKDILTGVAGWNYSTTNSEPTTWNEVNPAQKSFTHTIDNLANNTTYYIWAKDANGNVSAAREINTKDFEEFDYTVSWENATATITVNAPKTGVQFKTSQEGAWENYLESNKPQVSSGTTVYFQVTDGTNIKTFETVKPVKYNVVYHLNGGMGSLPSEQKAFYTENVVVDTAVTLTKTGYHFIGWALTSDATSAITDFEMPANDVTLYAVWQTHDFSTNTGICTICNLNENYLEANNETKMSNWDFSSYRGIEDAFRYSVYGAAYRPVISISHWASETWEPLGGNVGSIVYKTPIDVTNMKKIVMNVILATNAENATNYTTIGLCKSNSNEKYEDFSNFVVSEQINKKDWGYMEKKAELDVSGFTGKYYLKITVKHHLPDNGVMTSGTMFNSLYPVYQ